MEQVDLYDPQVYFRKEFLAMVDEFERAGELRSEYQKARLDFLAYVGWLQDQSHGIGLSPEIVPMSMFWLVMDRVAILGEVRLRHHLTPALEVEGGNIGYLIRPSERRNWIELKPW